jgi:Fe-S oxidoreductase
MNDETLRQQEIEANNLLEEVEEILGPCMMCGLCRHASPEFWASKGEHLTARGRALLMRDKSIDSSWYESVLSGSCEVVCPIGVKLNDAVRKVRGALVLRGIETEENKKMIARLREGKNPYGREEIVASSVSPQEVASPAETSVSPSKD